jgi:hypothetical protein
MAWRQNTAVGRLYSIVVDPACQGQGLGSLLLQACETAAMQRGCDRMSLEVRADNRRAIAMYERRGYRVQRALPGYYEDGAAGVRMVKRLCRDGARAAADRCGGAEATGEPRTDLPATAPPPQEPAPAPMARGRPGEPSSPPRAR